MNGGITEDQIISLAMEGINRYGQAADTSALRSLLERYTVTNDQRTRSFLAERIISTVSRLGRSFPAQSPVDGGPSFTAAAGGIELGDIALGSGPARFSMSKEDFNKGVLVIGSAGHGKTSFIYSMIKKLREAGVASVVFDSKRDYPSLALEDMSIYLNPDNLRINPLKPPCGTAFEEWAVHFSDIFSHSFALLIGSRDFMLDSLLRFYRSRTAQSPPSLPEYLRYLEACGERNDYIKVIKGRIKALLSSSRVFDCVDGIDLSKLDDHSIIFSIDRLGVSEQGFLVSFFMYYSFFLNINSNVHRGRLYKMIVIDDAHRILDVNKERDHAMGVPLLHTMIAKMREMGIGFIFSDQQISSVLSSAIQNTNTKFIGRVNLLSDLYHIFGKSYEAQAEALVSQIPPRSFLLLSDRISPFGVFRADAVVIDKDLDESLLIAGNSRFKRVLAAGENDVRRAEDAFLAEISSEPFVNLHVHEKNLENIMPTDEFRAMRSSLFSSGAIGEVKVSVSEGRAHKFIFIADAKNDSKAFADKSYGAFTKESFTKNLLRHLATSMLKEMKIRFEEDESGVLIRDRMTYITFIDDGSGLAKIIESPFRNVINIIDDETIPTDIILNMMKHATNSAEINFGTVKNCRFFELPSILKPVHSSESRQSYGRPAERRKTF